MKKEWFQPSEVAVHNRHNDCWVSLNGKVLDLTEWLQFQHRVCQCTKSCTCTFNNWACRADCLERCPCFRRGYLYCDGKRLASTILAFAGKDISHWFNGDNWITYVHPIASITVPYVRYGPDFRQPVVPSTRWRPVCDLWWLDPKYVVGKVTAKTRPIRITNTITGHTATIEVCSEETLFQIMNRYFPHNCHMNSYTWRYLGRPLKFNKTLDQNGIPDERERFTELMLPDTYIPTILLYYNDDLTVDPTDNMVCFCNDNQCK